MFLTFSSGSWNSPQICSIGLEGFIERVGRSIPLYRRDSSKISEDISV
uniref:Uncharacterized protein n=1 Tax=Lepeophtheirus salmonis TaxID=72036 RepID=A0A0K2VI31_LEPSM